MLIVPDFAGFADLNGSSDAGVAVPTATFPRS
ncbi:hypothetical protein X741_33530 [Mesorhizobium sp. LNHC229A00]|nr:hypothetical protein X741_33530 [Mesorhizobium sp. LNHC229A00]